MPEIGKGSLEMCAPVVVTEENARDLITQPGNPRLIWDGTEARVITEDFYHALNADSAWLLIMRRADLAGLDPAALDYHPATLAGLLTTSATTSPPANAPASAKPLCRPRPPFDARTGDTR
jgi:hypothetical protein